MLAIPASNRLLGMLMSCLIICVMCLCSVFYHSEWLNQPRAYQPIFPLILRFAKAFFSIFSATQLNSPHIAKWSRSELNFIHILYNIILPYHPPSCLLLSICHWMSYPNLMSVSSPLPSPPSPIVIHLFIRNSIHIYLPYCSFI